MRELKENEYIKDDLIWCSICNTPKQMYIRNKLINFLCKCESHKIETEKRNATIAENQRKCYAELGDVIPSHYKRTLKDLDRNKYVDIAEKYVNHFDLHCEDGTGLLLFGGVGTGKSTLASAIANEILFQGFTVKFTNFTHIMDMYESKDNNAEKLKYRTSLNRYHLLVIDDYGIERNTSPMQELIYEVINGRYEAKKPMLITTNKTPEPNNQFEQRVFDRIISRCDRIKMDGESRRIQEAKKIFL